MKNQDLSSEFGLQLDRECLSRLIVVVTKEWLQAHDRGWGIHLHSEPVKPLLKRLKRD